MLPPQHRVEAQTPGTGNIAGRCIAARELAGELSVGDRSRGGQIHGAGCRGIRSTQRTIPTQSSTWIQEMN